MTYVLGRTGLRVSRLALGAMTFGTESGWGTEKDTARQIFNRYVESGGNFVDTADLYTNGVSEQWMGEFIRERQLRARIVLATKFSYNGQADNPNAGANGRTNMLRAFRGSLRRLGTDYIDLHLLHTWDMLTPVDEVMRTFDDLVRSGKVRRVGLSDVPAWYASRAQAMADFRGYEPISALQMDYSLVERSIENEFIPLGLAHGMWTMVWSPLASGLLSGKYRPSQTGQFGEGRLQTVGSKSSPAFSKLTERNFAIVAELEAVGQELGRSIAQVALNWVANRAGVASVIVGATTLAQLEDNLDALKFTIPDELASRLDQISAVPASFPYTFFTPGMQAMLTGTHAVGDKPKGYLQHTLIDAPAAGV